MFIKIILLCTIKNKFKTIIKLGCKLNNLFSPSIRLDLINKASKQVFILHFSKSKDYRIKEKIKQVYVIFKEKPILENLSKKFIVKILRVKWKKIYKLYS